MGIFKKFFQKRDQDTNDREPLDRTSGDDDGGEGLSFTISGASVSSSPVGINSGSKARDFYVYQWFIKDTEEIFYVGKGRGSRYKDFHERAYEAEKIREMYDTDSRFIETGLTEEQAIELESKEMARILNETNDRLTNRIIPLTTKRDNGYGRSQHTPELQFETTPCLYASEIDEHYFNITHRPFDEVDDEHLKSVVMITRNLADGIEAIYGGSFDKYLEETNDLLSMNGGRVLKSQYAKSVTAWVYIGDDYVRNYNADQEKALERLGRNVPTYHLLDVRKFLLGKYGGVEPRSKEEIAINPSHNRTPLKNIKNLNNWEKGFDEGNPYWEKGERERKEGNFKKAIELFDKSRYNGYDAPALYKSYAMAYRKLKDYDNEIAIIDEAIERAESGERSNNNTIMKLKERREKSILLKQKQSNT